MRFLTRTILLTLAFTVSVLPDYGQQSKAKQEAGPPALPPTPAGEYRPSVWKKYSSKRGLFSVMFPGHPPRLRILQEELQVVAIPWIPMRSITRIFRLTPPLTWNGTRRCATSFSIRRGIKQ